MGLETLRRELIDGAHAQAEEADREAGAKMHEIVRAAHTSAKTASDNSAAEAKGFVESESP